MSYQYKIQPNLRWGKKQTKGCSSNISNIEDSPCCFISNVIKVQENICIYNMVHLARK